MKQSCTMAMMVALLMAVSLSAHAEKARSVYIGLQSAIVLYRTSIAGDTLLSATYGRLGVPFNEYLAVEARGGISLTNGNLQAFNTNINVRLQSFLGAISALGCRYPHIISMQWPAMLEEILK